MDKTLRMNELDSLKDLKTNHEDGLLMEYFPLAFKEGL
jgi:hypothetical protein